MTDQGRSPAQQKEAHTERLADLLTSREAEDRADRRRLRWFLAPAAVLHAGVLFVTVLAAATLPASTDRPPVEHEILVAASRYRFDPPVIRVERGDRLRLRFAATDVVHGFYLEGYDLDVTVAPLSRELEVRRGGEPPERLEEVVLVADRAGKFRYRCSQTCGVMHPFMVGELVVAPNRLLRGATAAALTVLLGGLFVLWKTSPRGGAR